MTEMALPSLQQLSYYNVSPKGNKFADNQFADKTIRRHDVSLTKIIRWQDISLTTRQIIALIDALIAVFSSCQRIDLLANWLSAKHPGTSLEVGPMGVAGRFCSWPWSWPDDQLYELGLVLTYQNWSFYRKSHYKPMLLSCQLSAKPCSFQIAKNVDGEISRVAAL